MNFITHHSIAKLSILGGQQKVTLNSVNPLTVTVQDGLSPRNSPPQVGTQKNPSMENTKLRWQHQMWQEWIDVQVECGALKVEEESIHS